MLPGNDKSITPAYGPPRMASQFCMSCGQPLASGAQFCANCGNRVSQAPSAPGPASLALGGTPGPSGGLASPAAPATVAPPAPAPSISEQLGLQNVRRFLLQHLLVGPKHSYRVMDLEKRHLFTLGENVREDRQVGWQQLLGHIPGGSVPMVSFGGVDHPGTSYWVIDDMAGNIHGTLTLQLSGHTAMCTLADASGTPTLVVNVTHHPLKIEANATSSDGRPMLEARGNLLHHNFSIHDASGAEVAKIHEAWASVRDTYNLEMVGNVDPLSAIVFAVLIDHYKGK